MMKDLPTHYWDFIIEHLPDYTRRDDVLQSDIYTRYLEGGEVDEIDVEHFFKNRSRDDIEREHLSNEWELFIEAFEAFAKARYNPDIESRQNTFALEQLGNSAFVPDYNGAYYVANSRVSDVNDFLDEYINSENFVYEVMGAMDDEKMEHFNSLFNYKRKHKKVKDPENPEGPKIEVIEDSQEVATADRMAYLHEIGCDLCFVDTARTLARENLIKCGGMEMPAIVGGMLKEFYFNNLSGRTTMEDCVKYLAKQDVAGYGFDDLEATYRGKIAHLLLCSFTGMKLGTKWNGRQDINGGYIVVKNDGDVVAFHSTIADEFKDFLVAKMLMEGPSHSRHKDMTIYKEGDKYYLKLALQLRFTLSR